MRTRTLLILAVLASALVAAWWSVRARGPAGASVERRASLFAVDEIPLERVDRVEVARRGAPLLSFVRGADGWVQDAPFPHPADPASIREVIDVAASLAASRAVDPASIDPEARAALGLDPPAATVRLAWPGGERTVELGRRTIAGRAWARVTGRAEAASVDASLHELAVEGDARQWRLRRLHEPGTADVGAIELRYGAAPGQRLSIRRTGGKWSIDAPVATRADAEAVRGYVEALSRAEADAFAADSPEDLAPFGLSSPERGVRLERAGAVAGDAPAGLVDVGSPVAEGAPERFARVMSRPTVVQVGAKALAAIFPPPAFFVDPRGCDAVQADVRAVEFVPFAADGSAQTAAWRLERTLDSWTLVLPGAERIAADGERARRLLAQLCEARAPAVAFQRMPDALRIGEFVLSGAGGAALATVRVAHEPDGQWALDGGDDVLRVFPAGFDLATDAAPYAGRR